MRQKRFFTVILAVATASLLSGCVIASHTANGKTRSQLLGGLVAMEEGVYEKEPIGAFSLNQKDPPPGSNLTGNKISFLWGLISYRDQ